MANSNFCWRKTCATGVAFFFCFLFLFACSSTPVNEEIAENTLSRPVEENLGAAYEKMQADENEQALVILNAMLEGDTSKYSPYELATVHELRGSVNAQLRNYTAAKEDFETAHALGVFDENRQAALLQNIARSNEELTQPPTPSPIERPPPTIPEECKPTVKAGVDVIVTFSFDITEDGTVDNLRIINSTNDCFNEAVMENVSAWKFKPHIIDGKARRLIGQEGQLTYSFIEY